MRKDQDRGAVFRSLREAAGWTVERMAEVAGVTVDDIAAYERGERVPAPDLIRKVASELGVPKSVMEGTGGPSRPDPLFSPSAETGAATSRPALDLDDLDGLELGLADSTRKYRLEAAQRRDQGHPRMAFERLEFAERISRGSDKAWVLAQKAALLYEWGDLAGALEELHYAVREVEEHGEKRDRIKVRLQQAATLCAAGRAAEAEKDLAKLKRLAAHDDDTDEPLRLRLRWMEGRVADACGRTAEGAERIAEVRAALGAAGKTLEAALAAVELAVLRVVLGDLAGAQEAAEQAVPVLEARNDREALGVAKLLRRLTQAGTLTPERARSMLREITRTPTGRLLAFEAVP
jgi:transcriptional regulator with XRE-family HTH domain